MKKASPPAAGRRIAREKRTITAMIRIHCRAHHGGGRRLCENCKELLHYAHCRLDKCPFGEQKSTCNKCPVHCYRKDRREQVKEVMRFAGPRMLLRHPVLALLHMCDGLRGQSELRRQHEEE